MQLRRRCPRTTKCSALNTPSTLPTPVTDFLVSYTVILLSPSCPNIYQHISTSYMVTCHGIQTLRSLLTTRQISLLSARFLSAISLYTFNSHSWYPSVTHADIAPITKRLCRWTQNVLLKNILYILNMYIGIYVFLLILHTCLCVKVATRATHTRVATPGYYPPQRWAACCTARRLTSCPRRRAAFPARRPVRSGRRPWTRRTTYPLTPPLLQAFSLLMWERLEFPNQILLDFIY